MFSLLTLIIKTFRQLVVSKFTPRIQETKNSSKDEKPTDKPASFIRLLPPVPTKTQKKVNKIYKYFKNNNNNKTLEKKNVGK